MYSLGPVNTVAALPRVFTGPRLYIGATMPNTEETNKRNKTKTHNQQ